VAAHAILPHNIVLAVTLQDTFLFYNLMLSQMACCVFVLVGLSALRKLAIKTSVLQRVVHKPVDFRVFVVRPTLGALFAFGKPRVDA
jgi:hypothetical protein